MNIVRPGRSAEQVSLRLPDGLRTRIKEEAERNCRSMNSEIIYHLQRALFDQLEIKKADARA